jgi:uncharacterized protein DUF4262
MTLDPKKRDGLRPVDAGYLAKIDEHGWAVMKVAPRVGDAGDCFAYSTGLFRKFGQPEILIFGLELDLMHQMINIVGKQMRSGVHFEANHGYSDILDRYDCQFRVVHKTQFRDYLGFSIWFYEGLDFPALQCFWPDREGYFPWQDGYSPGLRKLQPFLFLSKSDSTNAVQ